MDDKIFFTVAELAKKMRMSRWAIYLAVRENRLPAMRLGPRSKIVFDKKEIAGLLVRAGKKDHAE